MNASHTKFVAIALLFGVTGIASARVRESGVPTPLASEQTTAPSALVKHVLKGTYFDASSPGASASCGSAKCSAFAPIYLENIVCPGVVGAKCTYQITIQSQNRAGSNDGTLGEEGVYQFFVDGAAPNPGPVSASCACYAWSGASQKFSLPIRGTSYAVTATVTNATANQSHSIAVNIGCNEVHGNASGCFAGSGFANLSVAVYAP
jgi:hypothetical protein